MKVCNRCHSAKPTSEFHKRSKSRDGRQAHCKECGRESARLSQNARLPEVMSRIAAWNKANPERSAAHHRKWRERNQERVAATNAAWKSANLGKARANQARRREQVRIATPQWANFFFIEEAYHLAALRTAALGIQHHVDHIIPLRGRTVCGLHVETNLQVIPALENLRKGVSIPAEESF